MDELDWKHAAPLRSVGGLRNGHAHDLPIGGRPLLALGTSAEYELEGVGISASEFVIHAQGRDDLWRVPPGHLPGRAECDQEESS